MSNTINEFTFNEILSSYIPTKRKLLLLGWTPEQLNTLQQKNETPEKLYRQILNDLSFEDVKDNPSPINDQERICPYCGEIITADFVDIGVGFTQCGPYHCHVCGASEIGPEASKYISFVNNEEGYTSARIDTENAPFTEEEFKVGFYKSQISPLANTVDGQLVDHKTAKALYNLGLLDEKEDL